MKLTVAYFFIILILIFRIYAHPDQYTTPDSTDYINKANQIKSDWGKKDTAYGIENTKGAFTQWPIGYPTSIAMISLITGTSPLVSSKIVNFIFLGLIFILLYRWFEQKAWFSAISFFSYGTLELYSHTWSEPSFIFFVLLLCFFIANDFNDKKSSPFLFLKISICLVFLFLFRYAGLIYFILVSLLMLKQIISKNYQKSFQYFIALALSSIIVLWYLYLNKVAGGNYFGEDRFNLYAESWGTFFGLVLIGIINVFSVARNYFFNGYLDFLYLGLLFIQLIVIYILFQNKRYLSFPFFKDWNAKMLIIFGIFYLIVIAILGKIQPYGGFDYRIMAPFAIPVFIGFFSSIAHKGQEKYFSKCSKWILFFMLLSLFVNLPKRYIVNSIKDYAQQK